VNNKDNRNIKKMFSVFFLEERPKKITRNVTA